MSLCHTCGANLQENSSVQRVMRTGWYTEGGAFYRTVNLCLRCDAEHKSAAGQAKVKKVLVTLAGIATLLGGFVYFWFLK